MRWVGNGIDTAVSKMEISSTDVGRSTSLVSVVIPTDGRRISELTRAVDSALKQTKSPHEVLVIVDSGASVRDKVAQALLGKGVTIIATGQRMGAPYAR